VCFIDYYVAIEIRSGQKARLSLPMMRARCSRFADQAFGSDSMPSASWMLLAERSPSARPTRDAISAAPDNCLTARTELVQSCSLLTVRLHRLNFYVVLRKLIPKLQTFPKSIHETLMVRFYSSIHADDKMLIRQMSCDSAFHGIPHQIAAAHRTKTECLGSVPDHMKHNPIRVRNSLFLVRRHDI
jgi:hypothetical protein